MLHEECGEIWAKLKEKEANERALQNELKV